MLQYLIIPHEQTISNIVYDFLSIDWFCISIGFPTAENFLENVMNKQLAQKQCTGTVNSTVLCVVEGVLEGGLTFAFIPNAVLTTHLSYNAKETKTEIIDMNELFM